MDLTVIVPAYNADKYIVETLRSIQNSTFRDFELIVVNDGSTDKTLELIYETLERAVCDTRVFSQPNAGEAAAVNLGFSLARGQYVVVVNADDPIDPTLFSESITTLRKNSSHVVSFPAWRIIDSNGDKKAEIYPQSYDFGLLFGDHECLPGPGAVIRKSAVKAGQLRSGDFRFVSDYALWLELSLEGRFILIPKVLASWRDHASGLTASGDGKLMSKEFVWVTKDFINRHAQLKDVWAFRRQAVSMAYYRAALLALSRNNVPAFTFLILSLLTIFKRVPGMPALRRDPFLMVLLAKTRLFQFLGGPKRHDG